MKLAYFSPLNPLKSGISDYSEFLLPYLSRYSEVDLWVDGVKPNDPAMAQYKVIDFRKHENLRKKLADYDAIIYNLGNNPEFHARMYDVFLEYPGYVILHDFVLYYLVTGYHLDYLRNTEAYLAELYYNYGDVGIRAAKEVFSGNVPPLQYKQPGKLPLVKRVVDKARGIIVHSEYAKKMVIKVGLDKSQVVQINQVNYDNDAQIASEEIRTIRAKYGVADTDILVASFGYIAPTKRNYQVIQAINEVQKNLGFRLKYLMVGEGDYVDACLNERIMKTGYIPLQVFEKIIECVDIVVNLRYPSMGETSAALLRALTAGKACIVTDDAWFSELPDDVVIKIPVAESLEKVALKEVIERLVGDPGQRLDLGRRAKEYVLKEHDPDKIAKKIMSVISSDFSRVYTDKYLDCIAQRLLNMGLTEEHESYLRVLSERLVQVL